MQNTNENIRAHREASCQRQHRRSERKLSNMMAVIMGFIVTAEIMTAGAMILNTDSHRTDGIALFFGFMVIYFGVVAVLAE